MFYYHASQPVGVPPGGHVASRGGIGCYTQSHTNFGGKEYTLVLHAAN